LLRIPHTTPTPWCTHLAAQGFHHDSSEPWDARHPWQRHVAGHSQEPAIGLEERREQGGDGGIQRQLPAALGSVGCQGRVDVGMSPQRLGERHRIDQREIDPLAQVRAGGVGGIADENGSAA
jgi:hypothetical protein